jgi:hypothetical protein
MNDEGVTRSEGVGMRRTGHRIIRERSAKSTFISRRNLCEITFKISECQETTESTPIRWTDLNVVKMLKLIVPEESLSFRTSVR